jgi:signal transduction histidine kinase
MAQELVERWATRGVRLHREGLERLGQVVCHASPLRRAVFNLMQHAVDAMPRGGTLTLQGLRAGSQIQLEVTDTGRGQSGGQTSQKRAKILGTVVNVCV